MATRTRHGQRSAAPLKGGAVLRSTTLLPAILSFALSAPSWAQSLPGLDESSSQGLNVAGIMLSPLLWIYLVPMTFLVIVLAGLIIYTGRRKQLLAMATPTLELQSGEFTSRRIELPLAQPIQTPAAARMEPTTNQASPAAPPVATMELQSLFSIHQSTGKKECPRCKRTYETVFELCPYDATALRPLVRNSNEPPPKRKVLSRLRCASCERRYELGARYCYADGLPLIPDTDVESVRAPRLTVCQSCGFEGNDKDQVCPHDDEPLTVIEPNDNSHVAPTIPLLLCKTCRRYASPGSVHCPHDGELLSPVVNARVMALSPTGFGVRRKLCRKCGTRFSGAATFCSHDGTKLTPIN